MRTYQRGWRMVAAVAACCLASGALALQPAGADAGHSGQPAEAQPSTPSLLSLTFNGGPIGDYILAVRKAAGRTPVNVVYKHNADRIGLPPLEISMVTLQTAVQMLEWVHDPMPTGSEFDIERIAMDGGEPVFVLSVRAGFKGPAMVPPTTSVFSIRSIIEAAPTDPADTPVTLSPSVVLSALESILSVQAEDGAAAPVLKFHADSGLVVVKALPEQVTLVSRAIATMQEDIAHRRQMFGNVDLDAIQTERNKAAINLQRAAEGLSTAQENLKRLEQLHAAGNVGEQELLAARSGARQMELTLQSAQAELDLYEKRLARLKGTAKASGPDGAKANPAKPGK